jgi:hypothetical protein
VKKTKLASLYEKFIILYEKLGIHLLKKKIKKRNMERYILIA